MEPVAAPPGGTVAEALKTLLDLKTPVSNLIWYTSGNVPKPPGSTDGLLGRKGRLYEGGPRVTCILECSAGIVKPGPSELPAFTSGIHPTLLDLAGGKVPHHPPLDGISLVPLLEGKMKKGERPAGFRSFGRGRSVPAKEIVAGMLEARRPAGSMAAPRAFLLTRRGSRGATP